MKILILNPNTTAAMTDQLIAVARTVALPDTELVPLTAPRGVPYIATRSESQIAGAVVLEMIAEHGDADAVVIGAFGDPGLLAARELFDVPIVGMAEAAMLSASLVGERFAIVAMSASFSQWYQDSVALYGMSHRSVGVVAPGSLSSPLQIGREELREAVREVAQSVIGSRGADVVILGGAPLAGLAADLSGELAAAVVEPIAAAVLQAEGAVRLGARPRGGMGRPFGKGSAGLSGALAAALAGQSARRIAVAADGAPRALDSRR